MYAISFISDIDNQRYFWNGGEISSMWPEEAACFQTEASAEATMELLRKTVGLHKDAAVVELAKYDRDARTA